MDKKEKIVNSIIRQIGEEKDRPAYEIILNSFWEDPDVVITALKDAKRRMKGKPPHEVRKYFMKIIKNLARGYGIFVFKGWGDPRM